MKVIQEPTMLEITFTRNQMQTQHDTMVRILSREKGKPKLTDQEKEAVNFENQLQELQLEMTS
ncbi:hypothetical protein [Kordia sp.]|uniref:hypothetical protein n=1 Tax=Kordia sp. TaxID=1965332 RepID=UPI0025C55D59|nr:hypothetical protein [Kordia sp.]